MIAVTTDSIVPRDFWKLPDEWQWISLNEVAPRDSRTAQPSDTPNQMVIYLGLENVEQGQWTEAEYQNVLGQEIRSSCIIFDRFHVLYGKLRPYLNKVVLPDRQGFGSTEWVPLRPDQGRLDRKYLAWFLRSPSFVAYASRNVTGARMPRARMDVVLEAPVPIPFPFNPKKSLDIQQRIVARIEALLAEVRSSRELLDEMRRDCDRITNVSLEQVFQKIATEYESESLDNGHLQCLTSGSRGWSKYANQSNVGPLFIRVGNVGFSHVDLTGIEQLNLPPNLGEVERTRVSPGDVLVTITGTIGRCCVAPHDLEEAYINQHVALIRLEDDLDPRYLMWFILSPSGGGAQTAAMQYGQTKPGLSLTNIRNLQLPIPSKTFQRQIVSYLDSIQSEADKMLELMDQDAKTLDLLEQSILERAFRGEL